MKLFLSIQAALITVGCLICILLTKSQSDAGFIGKKSYDDIRKINAVTYTISEQDASLGETAEDYVDFFENMYATIKQPFFDKQIIIATAKDSYDLYDKSYQQEIVIDKVIDGDTSLVGKTMPMLFSSGFHYETQDEFNDRIYRKTYLGEQISGEENQQQFIFDFGGLNVMKPEHTYLIFAQSIDVGGYTMLCAEKHQYTWLDLSETNSKIMTTKSFSDYTDNEIFTDSQAVTDDFYRLKKDVLEFIKTKYNIDFDLQA